MIKYLSLALFGLLLAGCTPTFGTDFRHPAADKLVFGQTTPADVEAMMGKPLQQSITTIRPRTDEEKKTLTAMDPAPIGRTLTFLKYDYKKGIPKREIAFIFSDEKLCTSIFFSNFPEDSSDYDDSKIALLVKGKTTEAEAIGYFGVAKGRDEYPSIRDKTSHALRYTYGVEGPGGGVKELVLLFDKDNVLQDYKFNSNLRP